MKCGRVMITKPASATSLMQTRTKLTVALSRVPISSMPVTSRAMKIAGTLMIPVAMTWPAASRTCSPGAAVRAAGMMVCALSTSPTM